MERKIEGFFIGNGHMGILGIKENHTTFPIREVNKEPYTGKGKVWGFSNWDGSNWQPKEPSFNCGYIPSDCDPKAPYTGKK